MIDRRVFLKASALAALPAVAGASRRPDRTRADLGRPAAVQALLIDDRYVEARMAGARMAAMGLPTYSTPDGDVTQVWLNHVGPGWKQQPATIAGITARPALFCLEQLALSRGLRVVFHGEHIVHPKERTIHQLLRGADPQRLCALDLTLAGRFWPALICESFASFPTQQVRGPYGRSEAALGPALPVGAQLLTSWIIAAA